VNFFDLSVYLRSLSILVGRPLARVGSSSWMACLEKALGWALPLAMACVPLWLSLADICEFFLDAPFGSDFRTGFCLSISERSLILDCSASSELSAPSAISY